MNENPLAPLSTLTLPPVDIGIGALGEAELAINAQIRIAAGRNADDTGDDLNLIVLMIMVRLRFPSSISDAATATYTQYRPPSYGSYFVEYYRHHGDHSTNMQNNLATGIAGGWQADAPGPFWSRSLVSQSSNRSEPCFRRALPSHN